MFRIYGKKKGSKRFSPLDYEAGTFVVNLIHATLFPAHVIDRLKKSVAYMNENNKGYVFEIRKA